MTMGVVSGFSIFFGVMGLRGIREHDPKKLWFFYLWKLGRFCFESMLLFTDMFEAPSRFVAFILFVAVTVLRGYCVWCVYSLHASLIGEAGTEAVFNAGFSVEEGSEHIPLCRNVQVDSRA